MTLPIGYDYKTLAIQICLKIPWKYPVMVIVYNIIDWVCLGIPEL